MIIDSKVTLACVIISAVAIGFYVWNRTSMLSAEIQECVRRLEAPSCPAPPPMKEKKKTEVKQDVKSEIEPSKTK